MPFVEPDLDVPVGWPDHGETWPIPVLLNIGQMRKLTDLPLAWNIELTEDELRSMSPCRLARMIMAGTKATSQQPMITEWIARRLVAGLYEELEVR